MSAASIAFHEAGHAVAHLALGIETAEIYLRDSLHEEGGGVRPVSGHGDFRAAAISYCAGPEAQQGFFDRCCAAEDRPTLESNAHPANVYDLKCAERVCASAALSFEGIRDEAAELVKENWPAITRLAGLLLERRSLTEREACEALGPLCPSTTHPYHIQED